VTCVRERTEKWESDVLSPRAALSSRTRGRERDEEPCPVRTDYQRDRDRIIHSKAFRRLKGKTQVFFSPAGDHYRTRMTHTLEVSQVARTLARALLLNEDLTEAIALGHDLGHTPFGHAGEDVLDELMEGGFHHSRQSVRVVTVLENDGLGLNPTFEVTDGILNHTKGSGKIATTGPQDSPATLEAEIVRFSDVIAYVNHDLDDALRAGLLRPGDLPDAVTRVMGDSHSKRIHSLVMGILEATEPGSSEHVSMEEERYEALTGLRDFMYERVYLHPTVTRELGKAKAILGLLWDALMDGEPLRRELVGAAADERAVADFLAGMTDAYAVSLHERLYIPNRWYHG